MQLTASSNYLRKMKLITEDNNPQVGRRPRRVINVE